MYSFYGGQPGSPFVIITTYRSIADMIAKFKLGSNYTAVHFDQHVMINTVNKNDPDNGKIYRRGYDFNNDMGGAEFVGTIVGPSGNAPSVQMETVSEIRRKATQQGDSARYSSGSYSVSGQNLVPGKTVNGTFNDSITWACCSVRNENNEDSTAYIGFTFPYHVIDVEASAVQPYIGGRYTDTSGAYRNDDYKHPFYEKWHLDIPQGVKGDSFKNLKVQIADTTIEPYEGQADDINNQNEVIVYEYYNYEDYKNGNPKKYYLGDYNLIKDIIIAQNGTITIKYNHTDKVLNKLIKWISSVSVDTNGDLIINYNTGESQSVSFNFPYVYTDPTATNLQWSGLGILTNSDETEYMNITFTMPLTQFIDSNINSIEVLDGKLYVQSQNGTHDLTGVILDSTNTTVTKTLSGLKFQIQTTFTNLQIATIEIVSVLINELDLEFTRQTP